MRANSRCFLQELISLLYITPSFYKVPIESYIPNPLRCFKCQNYGHHSKQCTKNYICSHYRESGHPEVVCTSTMECSNCNGAHPACSRKCPKRQMEKQNHLVKYTQTISFPEAWKIVQAQSATTQQAPYASLVSINQTAKTTSCITTQSSPVLCNKKIFKSTYVQIPDQINAMSSLTSNTPKPSISA